MKTSIVIASAKNNCIGINNTLPWSLPKDLKRFKEITSSGNNPVIIMGRKTYESIGRPLPNRINCVLTSNPESITNPKVLTFSSLEKCLEFVEKTDEESKSESSVYIIGGASVLQESVDKGFVDTIHHTLVDAEIEGDTFINLPEWEVKDETEIEPDENHSYKMFFRTLTKN